MHDLIGRTVAGIGEAAWARQRPPRVSSPPKRSRPRRVTAVAASVIRTSIESSRSAGGTNGLQPSYYSDGTRIVFQARSAGPGVANAEDCHADQERGGRVGGGPQERQGDDDPGQRGVQGGVLVPVAVRVRGRDEPRGADRRRPRRLLLNGP